MASIKIRGDELYRFVVDFNAGYYTNYIIGRWKDQDAILHYSRTSLDIFKDISYLSQGDIHWADVQLNINVYPYSESAAYDRNRSLRPLTFYVEPVYLFANAVSQTKVNIKAMNLKKKDLPGVWTDGKIEFMLQPDGRVSVQEILPFNAKDHTVVKSLRPNQFDEYSFLRWVFYARNSESFDGFSSLTYDINEGSFIVAGTGSQLGYEFCRVAN